MIHKITYFFRNLYAVFMCGMTIKELEEDARHREEFIRSLDEGIALTQEVLNLLNEEELPMLITTQSGQPRAQIAFEKDRIIAFHGVPGEGVALADMVRDVLLAASPHLTEMLVPDQSVNLTLRRVPGQDIYDFFVDLQVQPSTTG